MPRRPREEAPGAFHHVVIQGNGRRRIVLDDVDRIDLVRRLAAGCATFDWRCHTYCLLDTHLHAVIQTSQPNLGRGLGLTCSGAVRAYHYRHGTEGHLYRRPFYSRRIHGEPHFVSTCLYVAVNPVAAGLCAHPSEWPWCSYRYTATDQPGFVDSSTLLGYFGIDAAAARHAYQRAVDRAAAEALQHLAGRDTARARGTEQRQGCHPKG
jgi:REP element-mobilizing transposase RayT